MKGDQIPTGRFWSPYPIGYGIYAQIVEDRLIVTEHFGCESRREVWMDLDAADELARFVAAYRNQLEDAAA